MESSTFSFTCTYSDDKWWGVLDLDPGVSLSALDALDLNTLGLRDKLTDDYDLQELTDEVDNLETLAKEMEKLAFLDNVDDGFDILDEDILFNSIEPTIPERKRGKKGGKRRKKQAKYKSQMSAKQMRKLKKAEDERGSSSVTLCQLMNICDSLPIGSSNNG